MAMVLGLRAPSPRQEDACQCDCHGGSERDPYDCAHTARHGWVAKVLESKANLENVDGCQEEHGSEDEQRPPPGAYWPSQEQEADTRRYEDERHASIDQRH